MAESIGLPKLKISFQVAAQTVANRSKKGYVGLIVRDTNAQGLHKLSSTTLIPSNLGEENKTYIQRAFTGSDRGTPSLVYLAVIAPNGLEEEGTQALEGGLKLLESVSLDYLAVPRDASPEELTLLTTWTKAQREAYRTVKLVRPFEEAGSDHMGIIELDEPTMTAGAASVTGPEYCGRMAGILAGIPMGMSCTNVPLPELTAVTARTVEEQESAIDAGKLILVHDGMKAKIARGVNSLVTIPPDGSADWRKIKVVEGLDLITYFLRTTIEDSWVGQYPNTYDNKQLLVSFILEYLQYLEGQGVLNPGSSYCEIDYDRQLNWLKSQGVEVADLTRQQVLEYQTGTWVFLRCGGRIVDAMEDFEVLVNPMSLAMAV